MVTFKKANSRKTITVFASVGALVGSGIIGSVGKASRQQDWMATDGATGRINLDAVKDALETSKDMSEFEKRVNEIYEGDNLILIRVEEKGAQKIISGFEDLNQSNAIEEAKDDKLFSITVKEKDYEFRGYGTNDYYYYRGGYSYYYDDDDDDDDDDKRFMYWLKHAPHSTSGPIWYETSRRRASQLGLERDRFRGSSAYTAQRSANKAFFAQQKASNPQAFNSRSSKVSSQRSTYQQKQMSRIEASRSYRESGASYSNIRAGS